jgi:hypothetical protein
MALFVRARGTDWPVSVLIHQLHHGAGCGDKSQEETMRTILAALTLAAALTLPLAGTAVADTGGTPNENATTQTGNADPRGRKGSCPVPGDTFSETAKLPGSNRGAVSNGNLVKLCILAGR